jgi:hypothetical protein
MGMKKRPDRYMFAVMGMQKRPDRYMFAIGESEDEGWAWWLRPWKRYRLDDVTPQERYWYTGQRNDGTMFAEITAKGSDYCIRRPDATGLETDEQPALLWVLRASFSFSFPESIEFENVAAAKAYARRLRPNQGRQEPES